MFRNIKIAKHISLISLMLAITGCIPTVGDLPANYHFNPAGDNGLVFFSVVCNLAEGRGHLGIFTTTGYGVPYSFFTARSYNVDFNCFSPDQALNTPEVKILDLPSGWYEVNGFDVVTVLPSQVLAPIRYPKTYFKVLPGKIQYLGRNQYVANSDNTFKTYHGNAITDDLPILQQKIPNVTGNEIINNS